MPRPTGSKNKAVIERERVAAEIAARTVADARTTGKKLAKEVLEEFMHAFAAVASRNQPTSAQEVPNDTFEKYAILAVDCATRLAKYQSPTFQSVTIAPPPDPAANETRRRFTLTIFDGPPPPQLEERALKLVNP